MPSFLVNPKMNSTLASRVNASLRGARRGRPPTSTNASRTRLLRLGALAVLSLVGLALVREVQTRNAQLAAARKALLDARAELQSTLTPRARAIGERLERLLMREASAYHGDLRHERLATIADLDAMLKRPIAYTRVDIDAVTHADRFDAALADSHKDAFVACLEKPPADRSEKELMKRVADAFSRDIHEYTANIHRVHDALVTLRVLAPDIDRQIAQATVLEPHEHMWQQARIDERLPAVFAEVLVAVLDEPKAPDTPVELDGASVHRVRVVVVDISDELDRVLLRAQFDLNPSWVSERRRHQYARALDACRMAYDVRAAFSEPNKRALSPLPR